MKPDQASLPRLSSELRVTLSRRMALAAFLITALASTLHLGWSLHQRGALESKLRDALARSLQEPLRAHHLPAVQAILHAFKAASQDAEICVKLPGGDWLKEPRCGSSPFETYPLNLSKDQFEVSVTLPMLDRMVLFGIPFGLAILFTLLLISRYLRVVSGRVLNDLDRLVDSPGGESRVHYQELALAGEKIAQGFRLQKENLTLAADAQIGAIAGLAGHDIRAPLETLQVLALDFAERLPADRREIFERVTKRIGEVAEDLLHVGKLAGDRRLGTQVQWPPKARQGAQAAPMPLALLLETMGREKRVQYQRRPGLEISVQTEPQSATPCLAPRDFERVLSNLVNNSIEAMDGPGKIEITLGRCSDSSQVEVVIRDTGRGIPPQIQGLLMKKGETFGKANGSGLGLFHAKEKVESWGGSIAIESAPGVGTTVRLRFPPAVSPDLVLIDDDLIVHDGWRLVAEERGLKLACFDTLAEFLRHCPGLPGSTPIYIDKNGAQDGIEVASALRALGFDNLHMTTGERMPEGELPPGLRSVIGKRFPAEITVA